MRGALSRRTAHREGRRRHAVAAAVLVVTAATGLVRADADIDGTTDAALDLGTASLPIVYHDGDFIVFGTDPADGKAGAPGGYARRHDGFSTYNDAKLLDHYDVRIVESAGADQVRPLVAEAVAAASAAGGQSLALHPDTVAPTGPQRGQIDIVVSSSSPCGGWWLGCGGPNIDDGVITSGQIWINPRLFERPPAQMENTVRHELGHTLGLAHYEYYHEDKVQTMHPSRFDAPTYEAGDTKGLRFTAGNPPVEQTAPQATEAVDPVGFVESVTAGPFGIVLRGWALDPETNAPIRVTVTVDGVPSDVVAEVDRGAVDGDRRGHAFESVQVAGPGPHEVCATARNVGRGSDTPLGCRVVFVSASSVGLIGLQTF